MPVSVDQQAFLSLSSLNLLKMEAVPWFLLKLPFLRVRRRMEDCTW